jgi:(E)-4-hydroxy-3-methylbut-2-enyl-diphosphate synthase
METVVKRAGGARVPIRIGVNSGSLPQKIREDYPDRAEGMVQLALETVKRFEDWGFDQIKISLKSSDIPVTVRANRLLAERCPYPLHLGITEAGDPERGIVASAMGIGALLLDGIGDTIRVSLTGDPVIEIRAALLILDLLGLGTRAVADVFSCPTCTRTHVNLLPIVEAVRSRLQQIPLSRRIRVAVMGCEVNGPGEASEADVGIAFSQAGAFLFAGGDNLGRFEPQAAVDALVAWVSEHFTSKHSQGV